VDEDEPIKGAWIDSVALEFDKLLRRHKLKALGMRFYGLRHTFQTAADETHDYPAIMKIMGHAEGVNDMSARYREKIGDDRLRAVAEHVRAWLWPPEPKKPASAGGG
jgi:integrase